MKVLVCGGRTYEDERLLNHTLDTLHAVLGISVIIHGDAGKFYDYPDHIISDEAGFWVGADKLAGQWARRNGVTERFYKPDWNKYGRKAGPMRNQLMLDESVPDLVLAFPGGRGTKDMVKRARAADYKVCEIGDD